MWDPLVLLQQSKVFKEGFSPLLLIQALADMPDSTEEARKPREVAAKQRLCISGERRPGPLKKTKKKLVDDNSPNQ